jgi:hypothetical protein
MITSEKLSVYREFGGDEDGWQRAGCPKRGLLDDGDWVAIRNLMQELTMLKRNLVSAEYGEQIRQRLADMTADQDTARVLLEMI